MKKIKIGVDWIQIDEDRIQLRSVVRYQVAINELKFYMLTGEIFKITLESEAIKNQVLGALDEMCQLVAVA